MGTHTPENLKSVEATHALVLMYRPLQGNWYQVNYWREVISILKKFQLKSKTKWIFHPLAAFPVHKLNGDMLDNVLMEGIRRLEHSGFNVDGISMDGNNVNRKVWDTHEIEDGKFSCPHPCDPKRKLFFFSDHSHLLKCLRNTTMRLNSFMVKRYYCKMHMINTTYSTIIEIFFRLLMV